MISYDEQSVNICQCMPPWYWISTTDNYNIYMVMMSILIEMMTHWRRSTRGTLGWPSKTSHEWKIALGVNEHVIKYKPTFKISWYLHNFRLLALNMWELHHHLRPFFDLFTICCWCSGQAVAFWECIVVTKLPALSESGKSKSQRTFPEFPKLLFNIAVASGSTQEHMKYCK